MRLAHFPAAAMLAMASGLVAPSQAQVATSLNTTSQNRPAGPYSPMPQQPFTVNPAYRILSANDLGAHCTDLDARIASILPPFNVVHAQVLATGTKPTILSSATVNVVYSAAANPRDPALATAPILARNGAPYKSNFGGLAAQVYAPLFPSGVLAQFFALTAAQRGDVGLPVPDVTQLFLGSGKLGFHQATMPDVTKGIFSSTTGYPTTLTAAPYTANVPQPFRVFDANWPVFTRFAFGYVANRVNWFAAEGIPIVPFDDAGRENPYPLMRVQARDNTSGRVLSSLDVVVPVSSETNCKNCHLSAPYGNSLATWRLTSPTQPSNDPQYGKVLQWVSEEWAADVNILRSHDAMHGTSIYTGYNSATGAAPSPVLCQTCHYSPALDLAQGGPATGPGLGQTTHGSMSRVMHAGHGALQAGGQPVFPTMPPPNDARRGASGNPVNTFTQGVLESTCYQCHPGKRTQCLRGAMYAAGVVCQDCHGQMTQVGDDFSRDVARGGAFTVRADYYSNPATPRVPWLNEPTCGSCHTGDAASNKAATPGALAAPDHIRLVQAFLATDAKAMPILPTNLRFAEPRVASGTAKGNPQLFRLSVDTHGGVLCEGCHGSTHAEWPVVNANANDNIAATQMQGHAGKLMECDTCHTGSLGTTLSGPHGMHPVGNKGYSTQWVSGHGDLAEHQGSAACKACHGQHGEGTVLAESVIARPNLKCEGGSLCSGRETTVTLPAGTQVGCGMCHRNPIP